MIGEISTYVAQDGRTASIHIYDALNYEVLEQLQEEVDREFGVRVTPPDYVEFKAQDLNVGELRKLTLEKMEENLEELTVGPETEINGGKITRDYTGEPSLLIHVEEYTDEVKDVLSVFNLDN